MKLGKKHQDIQIQISLAGWSFAMYLLTHIELYRSNSSPFMESYRVLVLVGTSQCKKERSQRLLIPNYCINMCNVASFSNSQLCSSNPKPMEISQNLEAFLDNFDNTLPSWRCWDAEVLKVGGRVSISDVLSTLVPLGWWILALWHGT